MKRALVLLFSSLILLTACATPPPTIGSDGKPLPRAYRISSAEESRIQFRMLDAVNALRQVEGAREVRLDASLNAAAATHSRDMAVQNRPWHFGSDGSSPVERAWRAGYRQTMLGENISETYETELQTLAAWMEETSTRDVILDAEAEDMGLGWYQESGGKIWWTLIMGGGPTPIQPTQNPLAGDALAAAPEDAPQG